MSSLTLYYHPLSSFCHKALIALYEHGVDFDKRIIDLGAEADRAALQALWPFCKFPVIHDPARNRSVAETSIIIEYLDLHFGSSRPLIPSNREDALEVRFWDRLFDLHVQVPMQQIVADRFRGTNGVLTNERATLDKAYAMLERHMASRTWARGEQFSMADCAAGPALFYASTVQPFPAGSVHLQAYLDRLTERPSYKRVLEEARPYLLHYPFAEAVPKRFL